MAKPYVIFGILILQIYVNAAPSDISKLEDIVTIEEAETKLDDEPILKESENNYTSQEVVRQKRFYNYYGYGFPPISPIIYPGYGKRDEATNTGVYGTNDPFDQIHQRLKEIASIIKQPPLPPPPPVHIPVFYPVLFIPQGCNCNIPSNNNEPNQETPTSTESNQTTTPNVTQRLPDIDTDEDYELEYDDNNRPISFDPIVVNTTLARPPPPVEHGSSQAGVPNSNITTTTNTPKEGSVTSPPIPPNIFDRKEDTQAVPQAPSICDGAVLSCCHQLHVTYDCFALQGCPDPTSYGNPCEVNVILSVIYKFQNYYAQRNG